MFRTIHDLALMVDRDRAGREASPSGGILDSQSVKAPAPGAERAFDGAKKIVGRKRHIAVDTDGRLLAVNLTTGDISDSAGAQMILTAIRKRWPWIKHLYADSAYDRASSWTRPHVLISSSKSSDASKASLGSMFCRDAGSSSGPSAG
jgi:hypothetical protein